MKKQFFLTLLIFVLFTSFSKQEGAKLTVEIKGISEIKGNIHVALFREEDDFPNRGGEFKGLIQVINQKESTAQFSNLPPDTYAIAVFHDANANGKLDKTLVGMPTEKYGFSNQARGTFSAPSFESASFSLQKERKIQIIIK